MAIPRSRCFARMQMAQDAAQALASGETAASLLPDRQVGLGLPASLLASLVIVAVLEWLPNPIGYNGAYPLRP